MENQLTAGDLVDVGKHSKFSQWKSGQDGYVWGSLSGAKSS
jgi:hypothetical protein